MTVQTRKIVKIDEDKCNGCGECVPSCAEGAIRIIDGKARLVADKFCDGLGNCLGTCPMDAITIEERPAEEFDEQAVEEHIHKERRELNHAHPGSGGGGCPGSMLRKLNAPSAAGDERDDAPSGGPSRLGQWPVQLALLPTAGDLWNRAHVLLAADCVAFAMGNFHDVLLNGRTVAVACPKLDDPQPYVQKLTRIVAENDLASLTIARMEVPCCSGLTQIVRQALDRADRNDLPVTETVVSLKGDILRQRPLDGLH